MPLGRSVDVLAPLSPEDTTWWDAGVVRVGLEVRTLKSRIDPAVWPDAVDASYDDGGPTIHVVDAETGREYLRFDCFREDPHYHYNVPSSEGDHNRVVVFDPFANGVDMFGWAIARLQSRLGPMLSNTGGAHLASALEQTLIDAALMALVETARESRE
jgi:hypothetical protein